MFEPLHCHVTCTQTALPVGDVKMTAVALHAQPMAPNVYKANDVIPAFVDTLALLTNSVLMRRFAMAVFVSQVVDQILIVRIS